MMSIENKNSKKSEEERGVGATTPSLGSPGDSITPVTSDPKNWLKFWKGKKHRAWLFVVHNYTEDEVTKLRVVAEEARYCVWGYELTPTEGTPHLQGFICWDSQRSVVKWRNSFTTKCVHVKADKDLKGTHYQNSVYCKKPETKDPARNPQYEEFGELPSQGQRNDWAQVKDRIKNGEEITDILEDNPHLIRNQRQLNEYKYSLLKPCHREVNVIVLWGAGGTGKTRWAYENYPGIWTKPTNKSSGSWWNSYSGQKQILLDDYYGGIAHHEFLRITDRYPYDAPICGGGYVQAQWDTVVITSNKHPKHWYQNGWGWPLRRRLKKIIKVSSIDGQTHYEAEDFPASEEAWRSQEETDD